jgi:uncharacterized protein YidB (DUF937 family)
MQPIDELIADLWGLHEKALIPLDPMPGVLPVGERGSWPDLTDRFTKAGSGKVMACWLVKGERLPIAPHDWRLVRDERVQGRGTLAGLALDEFWGRLAWKLPAVIRGMVLQGGGEVPAVHGETTGIREVSYVV